MAQQLQGIYNPVLGSDFSTSAWAQQIQRRRQERLLAMQIPQAEPKAGILRQFIHGTSTPITGLASKLGIIEKPTISKPQGFGENVSRFLGNLLGFGMFLAPVLSPITGSLSASVSSAMLNASMPALLAKSAGAAASGAVIGGASAWLDDEDVGKGMLSRAATSAVFPFIGAGFSKIAEHMKPKFIDPVKELVQKTVMFPESTQDADYITRIMKYVPDSLKSDKYTASIDEIVNAMTPGGKLEGLTDAQKNYFTGQVGKTLTNVDKDINILLRVLRTQPGGAEFAQDILDTTGQARYGEIFKAKGTLADIARQAMYKMEATKASALDPKFNIKLSKKASDAMTKLLGATDLNEQLAQAEIFDAEAKSSFQRFLTRNKYSSLTELVNDPNVKASTLKALDKHIVKQNYSQKLLWDIQGQFSESIGELSAKDIPSKLLSRAFIKASGADNIKRFWHPDLNEILKNVNAKLGKSFESKDAMVNAYKAGDAALKPYIDQWDTVAQKLKDEGRSLLYGTFSTTIVPLPEDIEEIIAAKRAIPVPVPPELTQVTVPSSLKQVQQLKKIAEDYLAQVRERASYGAFDFLSEQVEEGKISFGTLYEEITQTDTTPASLFRRLIPIRHLFGKTLSNAFREATGRLQVFNETHLGLHTGLRGWKEYLGLKGDELVEAGKRISGFLENETVNQNTLKAIAKYDDDNPIFQKLATWFESRYGLSAKELRVASNARLAFIDIFKAAGIEDERFINAYYPHFKQLTASTINAINKNLTGLMDDGARITGYNWVNTLERSGALKDYEEDFFKAFSRYVRSAGKNIHYDNLFETWTKAFNELNVDKARMDLFEELKSSLLGRPGHLERQLDDAMKMVLDRFNIGHAADIRPTQAVSSFLTELQITGGLGMNPFAIVKNLTQKILFLPQVVDDPDQWMQGVEKWYDYRKLKGTDLGEYIDTLNPILQNRQFAEGMTYTNSAVEGIIRRIFPVTASQAAWARDKMFMGYQWADTDNVKDAFGTQFLRLIKEGAKIEDAYEIATSTAMATQFMYGFDSPMLYKTPVGKLLGVFMSWPLNWAMMLYEQGGEDNIRQAFATVGAMAVGASALSLTGFNFMSTHPVAVAQGILPLTLLEGQEEWPVSLRTGAATLETLRALANGDQTEIDSAIENLKRRLEPMIPMGVGLSRVSRFIDVVRHDWKQYDLKERFRRDVSVSEGIRSILGPTMEAQQRFNDYTDIQQMESNYRRLRAKAIQAYMRGDAKKFKYLQEQLMLNFGKGFIEPADIEKEIALRSASAVERQLVGLPEAVRERFMLTRGYTPTVTERRQLRTSGFNRFSF